MRNIILIAPPAAGKGTQAKLLSSKYNIPHISIGYLLRQSATEQSEMGILIKQTIEAGALVPDNIVLNLLEKRIQEPDCNNGYILDGFPRNINQAESYLKILQNLNKQLGDVILLNIPKETAKKRIIGRLSCTECGAVYNDQFEETKPKRFGTCDLCNGSLTRRSDDKEKTFEDRYHIYENQTYPLVNYFGNKGLLFTVGSGISKERTFNEIEKVINRGNI